jgi:hypothetical protein
MIAIGTSPSLEITESRTARMGVMTGWANVE